MLHQRGQDLIGERQFQRRGGLALMDSQDALSPTDVVEADGNDLAGAQSVGSDQQKHRVVAQAHGRCPCPWIAKVSELFPTGGREGVAPGGRAAACRSGDPARWAPCHPWRGSGGILAAAAMSCWRLARLSRLPALADVRFDMAGADAPQGSARFLQVLEETLRGAPMAGNGGGRESANFAEVIHILAAQTRCAGVAAAGGRSTIRPLATRYRSSVWMVPARQGSLFFRAFQQSSRTAWLSFATSSMPRRRRSGIRMIGSRRIASLREPRVKPLAASQSSKPSAIGPNQRQSRKTSDELSEKRDVASVPQ